MTDDGLGIYMYCGMIGLNRRCWTQRYQELMLSLQLRYHEYIYCIQ